MRISDPNPAVRSDRRQARRGAGAQRGLRRHDIPPPGVAVSPRDSVSRIGTARPPAVGTPGPVASPGNPRPLPPLRQRARRWLGSLCLAGGVLAGLALIATAVLLGAPAGAEENGPVRAVPVMGYGWPLDAQPRVTRPFEPPPKPWAAGHRGVDLAATGGATVRAAGDGVVHFAGSLAGRGVVSVRHGNGLRTTYEPLEPLVAVGQAVRAGDPIGRLSPGHRGCPAVACLHWGLRHGETYLDPLSLLGLGRVRLLPLTRDDNPPG
ncbi:MAG: peptidoglycan DD-metalloendopeptidase family protein [Micromonosporaceae bacterium]|nr:peptidoglycan DD-metalloendopeptidase family protein [Micromonosporaceae bacterium]